MFNNYYIRKEVTDTVKDAFLDLAIGEVIEDYTERIVREAVPIIAKAEYNAEIKRYKLSILNFGLDKTKKKLVMHLVNI